MNQQSTLERAFILAKAGVCRSVAEIRTQLKKEQRDAVDAHLAGMSIQRQLKVLMAANPPA